ncbi:MAG TPA: hypothetical protein VKC57_16460, partial [Ktedonobacterales bacterium]|nr:hypothetical protein [Ktedonobacterales bacterium]
MASRLLHGSSREQSLRWSSRAFSVLATLAGAYLLARTASTVAAQVLMPRPGLSRPPHSARAVGTAIAEPEEYSLCQIANPDVNDTQVYAIGEQDQGARIYRVEKERVLLDNGGHNDSSILL